MTRSRRGRPPHPDRLTPAEWAVAHAIRHGLSYRRIARLRSVSLDAIRYHVSNVRAKLGLRDKAALRGWRGVPNDSALARASQEAVVNDVVLGSVGQIARGVSDIARAEAWYRDVLGLRHLFTAGTLAFFDCAGTRLMLERQSEPNPRGLRNDSVLYFRVPDIQAAFDALQGRGATFVGAPHMIYRHPDGTEEWMAFFEDCDGGILALMSQVRQG